MESKKKGIAMITRTKKGRVKVPRIKGLPHRRKTLVDTFLKRLTVFEIAATSLENAHAREQLLESIGIYKSLACDLRNKSVWPDDEALSMMRGCLTMLESSFALLQFGWDSDEYRHASAQSRRLEEEEMRGK
jgi:hypothetical protein